MALLRKITCNLRHPMFSRHPVCVGHGTCMIFVYLTFCWAINTRMCTRHSTRTWEIAIQANQKKGSKLWLEICGTCRFIIIVFNVIIEDLLLSFALPTSERSLSELRKSFGVTLCYCEIELAKAKCQLDLLIRNVADSIDSEIGTWVGRTLPWSRMLWPTRTDRLSSLHWW